MEFEVDKILKVRTHEVHGVQTVQGAFLWIQQHTQSMGAAGRLRDIRADRSVQRASGESRRFTCGVYKGRGSRAVLLRGKASGGAERESGTASPSNTGAAKASQQGTWSGSVAAWGTRTHVELVGSKRRTEALAANALAANSRSGSERCSQRWSS